jgi:putative hydrolase of the HAD superfamily
VEANDRAVLFDLYETLVTEQGSAPARASSLGPRLGLDAKAFRAAWRCQRAQVVRGEISFANALLEIGTMLGQRVDPRLAQALSNERRLEKAALFGRIGTDALSTLRQLRQCGYKLAVVSNCFAEDVEAWPACAAAWCFDTTAFSCAVGSVKPEPRIYIEAMQLLGVDPVNAVFIGDGGDDELLGAERAGLRAAQATWFRGERPDLPPHIPRLSSWPAVLAFAKTG